MADEPADRQRGLGLFVQVIPALTIATPAVMLVSYAFGDLGTKALVGAAPLVSLAVQFIAGWVLVRKRERAVWFAVASVVVALAVLGVEIATADDTDALTIASIALVTAGWPIATLIAVLRGPRTPFQPRRADLGGVLLAYGALLVIVGILTIVGIAMDTSRFGALEPWQIVLLSSPLLGIVVAAVFAVLAGIELAGAPRAGRSRLAMYMVVSAIVTVLVLALDIIGVVGGERSRHDSMVEQILLFMIGLASLYLPPLVFWRYAKHAKPLDVADSAAAAGGLRWAALFFAINLTSRIVERFAGESSHAFRRIARMLAVDATGSIVFVIFCVQIVLAIVAFVTNNRRIAMWTSILICASSLAAIAAIAVAAGEFRPSSNAVWPSAMTLGLFGSFAWLNRPRVRSERSLAAIFE